MVAMQGYLDEEPARDVVASLAGPVLIEFGTPWCGHCIAAKPAVEQVLVDHPDVRHMRVEDGPGRPLGRSFRVKLWPTLVLLRDGVEVARAVRPRSAGEVAALMREVPPDDGA